MMRRKATCIREGQSAGKKEGEPAHFGAHVRVRVRVTQLYPPARAVEKSWKLIDKKEAREAGWKR